MSNALLIIGNNITAWWEFMWHTDVPGTSFSFGALYMFVMFVFVFTFLVRLVGHNENKE